jgi:DNA (cytosine-5)-methyltransferase 1
LINFVFSTKALSDKSLYPLCINRLSFEHKYYKTRNSFRIAICAKELNIHVFTSLWKAFEEKLTNVTGKADLVQLSGYYQYNARINGVMNFNSTSKVNSFWRVVQCVTRCIGVSTQLTVQKCAEYWGVKEEEIFSHLQSLRSIGYEVRSHNTNPQIPRGEYLIPYSFPTLNPKSVQLHKIL